MDCTQIRRLLHGYLDQELDLANTTAIDQHLKSCAACKRLFERQSMLRSVVKQQATYYAAPAKLADRIRAEVNRTAANAPARTRRLPWFQFGHWLQLGTAIAATAAVTWIAAFQLNSPSQDELVAEQVISGHARSILTGHLADVASSDQHTVKPWLSSKLDFSPAATDLTTAGFPLVGGRLDYVDNRPVAALVYRHRQHMINLFVWPDPKSDQASPMQTLSKHGYHVLHWTGEGMTYWAISDLNPAEIKTFAETYASAK